MSQRRPSASLPKAVRIRRRTEFQQLQRGGSRRSTPHFVVVMGRQRETARLGITVSRRVGKAVVRNRIKRLVREFFRVHRREAPERDLLVIAKPAARLVSHHQVAEELGGALGLRGASWTARGLRRGG